MSREQLEKRANELLDQWFNGNRKEVMRALTAMSSMRAACVSAIMCETFLNGPSDGADAFISLMAGRLS